MGKATNEWHKNLMQVGGLFEQEMQPNICDQADSLQ